MLHSPSHIQHCVKFHKESPRTAPLSAFDHHKKIKFQCINVSIMKQIKIKLFGKNGKYFDFDFTLLFIILIMRNCNK